MTPATLGEVDATLTRDGDLYTLTCRDGEQQAVMETSHDLMREMCKHLWIKAAARSLQSDRMTIRFPGNQFLTVTIDSAKNLACFTLEELGRLSQRTAYEQLSNPRWN